VPPLAPTTSSGFSGAEVTWRSLASPSLTWRGAVGTPAVLWAAGALGVLQLVITYVPAVTTWIPKWALGN